MQVFRVARERLVRATEHRDAMARAWSDYLDTPDLYDVKVHVRDNGQGYIGIKTAKPLPTAISLELGEMLYQLRAALDACVYQAAIYETKKDPPPDENALEYPVCVSEDGFQKSAWKVRQIEHPDLADFIRRSQPFNIPKLEDESQHWLPESLGLLNDWARKDRHRQLHVMGAHPTELAPRLECSSGVSVRWLDVNDVGVLVQEKSVLATFELDGWGSGATVAADPNFRLVLGIHERDDTSSDPGSTLEERTEKMRLAAHKVLQAFEATY